MAYGSSPENQFEIYNIDEWRSINSNRWHKMKREREREREREKERERERERERKHYIKTEKYYQIIIV